MATTGLKTGTGDFTGAHDLLKEVYDKPFENNIEGESELWSALETTEGFQVTSEGGDGKGIKIAHTFSYGGGVYFMNEDDNLGDSTAPTFAQSTSFIPTVTATQQLSGKLLRRMQNDKVAFADWADQALPAKAERVAFHLDRAAIGTGTGIVGRIQNATPDGTDDIIGAAFGIAGLEGAGNLILRGDSLRYSPNANGSAPRAGAAIVSNKPNGLTGVFSVASNPTAAAKDDYVFLGSNHLISAGKEIMGLEGIIDDGTNLTALQGLSRTDYREMRGQIVDASSSQFGAALTEELIDYSDTLAFEQGNGGKPNVLFLNRSGNRSFWKSLKADRQFVNPGANYKGGRSNLEMEINGRIVRLIPCRKLPLSRAYGVDTSTIKRADIGPGGWLDTTGSVWQRVSDSNGNKDAYVAYYIKETQLISYDPSRNYKIINLAAA